jgi:hypothetical protein
MGSMSTNAESERVEITPELLRDLWSDAVAASLASKDVTVRPSSLLALVERIRELERERAAFEAQRIDHALPHPFSVPDFSDALRDP